MPWHVRVVTQRRPSCLHAATQTLLCVCRQQSLLCLASPDAACHVSICSCAVCKSVIGQIDAGLTKDEREDVEKVEKAMRKWCDTSKGKDKTMCYYLGVGDAESVRRRGSP